MTTRIEGYLRDEDLLRFLDLKTKSALYSRLSSGTGHPPYLSVGRKRLYPETEFREWLRSQPLTYEVSPLRKRHAR